MHSLRRQLTASLLVSFALILGAGDLTNYWAIRDSLLDQFDAALRDRALVIISGAVPRGESLSTYFSDRYLRAFDDDYGTEFFQVFDSTGRSVQRSDSLHNADLPYRFGPPEAPEYWNMILPISGKFGRAVGIEFTIPPSRRDRELPPIKAVVVVAGEQDDIRETLRDLRIITISTLLGTLLLTILAVWWTLRRNLRPIQLVSVEAAEIDSDSLDQRLPVETLPLELQPMTAKVNALLDRLQASLDRERRFSADLAHELRTPIAELRSLAEVALKWPDDRDPANDRITLEIASQLESRVTTLLQLARAEQGRLVLRPKPIALVAACEAALRPAQATAEARHLTIQRAFSEVEVTLETDPVLLRSILGNLIDNAVAYAPEGSTIVLSLTINAGSFSLSIDNPAPDLDEAAIGKLFDRFWRHDDARTAAHHSGLGLSLVETYAQLLGFSINAVAPTPGQLSMRLAGPRGESRSVAAPLD